MTKTAIAGGTIAAILVSLAAVFSYRGLHMRAHPVAATPPTIKHSTTPAAPAAYQGFIYGRITTIDGATLEGRLRWGGDEEAFWGDYFNGSKRENPWLAQVPPEKQPKQRRTFKFLGLQLGERVTPIDVHRQLMARFGEIARIEASGRDVRVTLKSGTAVDLDRLEASDFDDDLRVWDETRGVVDLGSLRIRSIELLPTPMLDDVPDRLHGTVRTAQGEFTGFILWDRVSCLGTDELEGRAPAGERFRFDTIRSIARQSPDNSLVTLLDGHEFRLTGKRSDGDINRGIYVDDPRYGRVLISWNAFKRIEFNPGGSGPPYDDFPPGIRLAGAVTTRGGNRLAGRLVFDLDESETTDTLDASMRGVDYTIPFGLVASIVLRGGDEPGAQPAKVTLHGGEELQLERIGDLGRGNAGMLIFVDGAAHPEYVPWVEIEQIDFDRPPAMHPPLAAD